MRTQTSTEHNPLKNSEREFQKYAFFKVDSHWRRLSDQERSTAKLQFASIMRDFGNSYARELSSHRPTR